MDETSSEFVTALEAMIKASSLCQKIREDLVGGESILKRDRSPVTIADYGSQAIICRLIRERFPGDAIVAEEDSKELRKPDHSKILEKVTSYLNTFIPNSSSEEVCSWIDLSSHRLTDRFWALDPIDGTKGFLRGDQYAIALALIENGLVKLGILACPNLYVNMYQPSGKKGCIFFALKGKGSVQMDIEDGTRRALSVSRVKHFSEATLIESFEADHSDHLFHQKFAEKLNISRPTVRMDSQAKYGVVARGEVAIYLRIPSPSEPGYRENIWDHAAGSIIAEEAGGRVTDALGHPLNFLCGVRMEKNYGIVATNGFLHEDVLKALEL
jgi:3'(2'), 5'-bisphosphate nucleotidase